MIRWLPASGLLAAIAFALTGLISPPPPVAGAAAAAVIRYYAGHHTRLELDRTGGHRSGSLAGRVLDLIFRAFGKPGGGWPAQRAVICGTAGVARRLFAHDAGPNPTCGIAGELRKVALEVSTFKKDVIDAAAREREVTLTTFGRKTGKASDVTIWIATDGDHLYIRSGQGMRRHWPHTLC